ncbi:MAG TPA: 50S ribosomal protein L4 [Candidatus Hydrogenedentes bacterium]|nr:50S ribosomal protein L4 [Candidatus Hydrogenedentota bacterium]HIJ74314.1 50S ribosomal protein L4 [Candidatus Hydrogenedentota bacterium]
MASAKLLRQDGSEAGSVGLSDAVFDVEPNETLVHEVTVALMNSRRQGNASTKTRREVRGGGRKPFRQKGRGRARQGSIREPQMRGGGTVFGPHKRSYRQRIPREFRRKALCCVLSDRLRSEALSVLEPLVFAAPKTRPFAELLGTLGTAGKNALFVTADVDRNVIFSARNIPRVAVKTASDLNVLDVLQASRVFLAQDAVAKLEERLS